MQKRMIITIGRQFCSGGSEIGRKLSERLGIPYYDKNLYEYAAKNRGFSTKYVREIEETPTGSFLYSLAMYPYVDFGTDNMIPSGSWSYSFFHLQIVYQPVICTVAAGA